MHYIIGANLKNRSRDPDHSN